MDFSQLKMHSFVNVRNCVPVNPQTGFSVSGQLQEVIWYSSTVFKSVLVTCSILSLFIKLAK